MQYLTQFFQILLTPLRLLFTAPHQLLATPRKMLGLSLAARIAIMVAVFLVLATFIVLLQALRDREVWGRSVTILVVLSVLSLVIPVVTYQALRLWLEGEGSPFPDIDEAWELGIQALAQQGCEVTDLPLFLLIGSPGEFAEEALFNAARLNLLELRGTKGRKALHWYATSDALYLALTTVGCSSALSARGEELLKEDRKRQTPRELGPERVAAPARTAVPDIRRTLDGINVTEEPEPAPAAAPGAKPRALRTMVADDPDDSSLIKPPSSGARVREAVSLKQDQRELERKRLAHLCKRIRRSRQPFCPINGALVLIPYAVVQRGEEDTSSVQMAVTADLTEMAAQLHLRFPVVALVTGMESEVGFRELVRRVGRERATEQRFGKGFSSYNDATPDHLKNLCNHACSAFEVFIYGLFKEKGSLVSDEKAIGNQKLFTLLCNVRRDFKKRLDRILQHGIGSAMGAVDEQPALFFGGCYFAAAGDTPECQGFVRSVVGDRLIDDGEPDGPLFENVEWTRSTLRDDARFRTLAYAGFVFDAMLLVATIILLTRFL